MKRATKAKRQKSKEAKAVDYDADETPEFAALSSAGALQKVEDKTPRAYAEAIMGPLTADRRPLVKRKTFSFSIERVMNVITISTA